MMQRITPIEEYEHYKNSAEQFKNFPRFVALTPLFLRSAAYSYITGSNAKLAASMLGFGLPLLFRRLKADFRSVGPNVEHPQTREGALSMLQDFFDGDGAEDNTDCHKFYVAQRIIQQHYNISEPINNDQATRMIKACKAVFGSAPALSAAKSINLDTEKNENDSGNESDTFYKL